MQIRTKLQDTWAQITEKLGDAWGRGIRYGLGPDDPDREVGPEGSEGLKRSAIAELLAEMSDAIDLIERAEHRIAALSAPLVGQKDKAQDLMDRLLAAVSSLGGAL